MAFSTSDDLLREELLKHLRLLEREKKISNWHCRKIAPGKDWDKEIDEHINSAHIITPLISSDFLGSDYCYDVELKKALERHERREAILIPIILRACDWHNAPFGKLQALPRDGKPITSWLNRDEAFTDVARGLRKIVDTNRKPEAS